MKKRVLLVSALLLILMISCNNNAVFNKSDYMDIRSAVKEENGINPLLVGTWESETMLLFLSDSGSYGMFEIPENISVNGNWTTMGNELFLVVDDEINPFEYSLKNTVLELKNKKNTYVLVKVSE